MRAVERLHLALHRSLPAAKHAMLSLLPIHPPRKQLPTAHLSYTPRPLPRCPAHAGADPDVLEFAGGFVQHTFLELGRAADDVSAIFSTGPPPTTTSTPPPPQQQGGLQPSSSLQAGADSSSSSSSGQQLAALLSVWMQREGRSCAAQLRRHALATAGAAASTALTTIMQVSQGWGNEGEGGEAGGGGGWEMALPLARQECCDPTRGRFAAMSKQLVGCTPLQQGRGCMHSSSSCKPSPSAALDLVHTCTHDP
jgi:hypothetical protein